MLLISLRYWIHWFVLCQTTLFIFGQPDNSSQPFLSQIQLDKGNDTTLSQQLHENLPVHSNITDSVLSNASSLIVENRSPSVNPSSSPSITPSSLPSISSVSPSSSPSIITTILPTAVSTTVEKIVVFESPVPLASSESSHSQELQTMVSLSSPVVNVASSSIVKIDDPISTNKNPKAITLSVTHDNLSLSNKVKRDAIVLLLLDVEARPIITILKMLDLLFQDNKQSDVIIFHNGYPFSKHIAQIRASTQRFVDFSNVDVLWSLHPRIKDFDMYTVDPSWHKREKWTYHHMIRFWFHDVFHVDVMSNVEFYMRLDGDSKFAGMVPNTFALMRKHQALYMANGAYREVGKKTLPGMELLEVYAKHFIKQNNIIPKNQTIWDDTFLPNNTAYVYFNNFEVGKVSFFHRPEVKKWIHYIMRSGGIYKYRWGDAPLRYVTFAIFADSTDVIHRKDFHIPYCHKGCNTYRNDNLPEDLTHESYVFE